MQHSSNQLLFGHTLEELVAQELENLYMEFLHFHTGSEEDSKQKIDFSLYHPLKREWVDFQITLRRGNLEKMQGFVEAALRKRKRGSRVYMEIHVNKSFCAKPEGAMKIARAVARFMKKIMERMSGFEPGKLLGVELHIGRKRIHGVLKRFSLITAVGYNWFKDLIYRILDEREKRQKTAKTSWQKLNTQIISRFRQPHKKHRSSHGFASHIFNSRRALM